MNSIIKWVYNKRNFLLMLLLSVIVMIPKIFNFEYVGHDAEFHFLNIRSIVNQLSWNNWFVKEPLSLIANNFGYGTRFFYPPLPHLTAAYIAKFLQIFHNNDILISMRITGWLTIFLSGISFYCLAKKIFKNNKVILLGTMFYMSAPYHLAEIYIRDAFSEMFIFISVPLIILGLLELTEEHYKKFYVFFTLGYTISIYSHMALSIYFTLILLFTFFPIYYKKIFTKKRIWIGILSCISILCFTAPFWLTLLEIKWSTDYTIFVPFYLTAKGDLQYSTLKLGDYFKFFKPHNYDYIRYHLQLSVTLLLFISFYFFFKNKWWRRKKVLFFLILFTVTALMTTNLFPWVYTPSILQTLQFPWRLTLFVQFSGIFLAMFCLNQLSTSKHFTKICIFLILFSIGESFYNTYHLDKVLDRNNVNTDYGMGNQNEYLPHKTTLHQEYYEKRENDILVLDGQAKINMINRENANFDFEVEMTDEATIEFPRLYYIGYQLTANEKKIKLEESANGFLQAKIKESGNYELKYTGTSLMKLSAILCITNFIGHLIFFLFYKRFTLKKVAFSTKKI